MRTGGSKLDIAIIGAQKCATTAIRDLVAKQANFFVPHGEDNFLDRPGASPASASEHLRKMSSAARGRRTAIKRADLLANENAAKLLHQVSPHTQLIVIVRDPVARAVSAFNHYAAYGLVPDIHVDLGLPMIIEGKLAAEYPRSPEVLTNGLYASHLERWRQWWPSAQFLVMRQENLIADPANELLRLERFTASTGLAEHSLPTSNVGGYSAARLQWRRLASSLRGREASLLQRTLGRSMAAADARWLWRVFPSGQPPLLSPQTRSILESYYADDQQQLPNLLSDTQDF